MTVDIAALLSRHPRTRFLDGPTPLEPLTRLSEHLGGPTVWAKRDDVMTLALGGNKVRKLEFLVGDALAQGCDTLITNGAIQSNHARLTAAAANKAGLACELVLVDRVATNDPAYRRSGNKLLMGLIGAGIHVVPAEAYDDIDGVMARIADNVRARGGRPYIVPEGGGSPAGGLGYVAAAGEILEQAAQAGVTFKDVFVGSGSGGTHAGLLAGSLLIDAPWHVTGVCVRRDAAAQRARIIERTDLILRHLGASIDVPPDAVTTDDGALGPGYGQLTEAVHEAIDLAARYEGMLLDPVYTGKVMAGLVAAVRAGRFSRDDQILFVHTGGVPGLFAYQEAFDEALR